MPIFTVTYCTMDQEVGSNPLWHTCILLSRFDENSKKLEVIDNWGFYGLPTTNTESVLRRLKIKMGLDVDLTGNHGMLRHEEIRNLDLGRGLHGVTFELTEEKFNALQKKCEKMAADQAQAIDDIVKPLNFPGKPPGKTRIYPYEHLSTHIYALEKAASEAQGRSPRLKPFELSMFTGAKTCKVQALNLLDNILTTDQITRIAGYHRAISRFSGKMEKIFLHSSGPSRQHVKSSGEVVHYRDAQDSNVKLHWTLPPQEIETLSGEVRELFKINDDHCDDVKKVIRKLQHLECLFANARLDEKYFSYRDQLVGLIRNHYEVFATIQSERDQSMKNDWSDAVRYLFFMPRNEDEKILMTNLANAKYLFTSLYMAVVDGWEIHDPAVLDGSVDVDLEALAAYLQVDKKKELCSILGRSYVEPEKDCTESVASASMN